jgi:hypothetical protein
MYLVTAKLGYANNLLAGGSFIYFVREVWLLSMADQQYVYKEQYGKLIVPTVVPGDSLEAF